MKPIFRYALELCVCFVLVHVIQFTEWQSIYPKSNQLTPSTRISDVPLSIEPMAAVNDEVAKELKDQVRILCWILTTPKYHWFKARHVKNTWGKRCNVLLFMSSEEDDRIPTIKLNVTEGYKYLWHKTREAFKYVWENYQDQADWFLKADDDSYIVLENLRYLLKAYNTSKPLYFGNKFKAHLKKGFMQGGAGYVLSREAVRRFVDIGLKDSKNCSNTTGPEDVEIARCLANLGCDGVDTRDSYGRERFLPWGLQNHVGIGYTGTTSFWDLRYNFYPIQKGFSCCSDTAIGFHKVGASDMYVYDYLIYRMNPYGFNNKRSEIQLHPDPPPDAELTAKPYQPTAEDKKWSAEIRKVEELEKNKFKQPPKNVTIPPKDGNNRTTTAIEKAKEKKT